MNNLIKILFLIFIFTSQPLFAQNSEESLKVKKLNEYVEFINSGIHGMLIVHRMLENFNQEVNKYVDLQSNQLNFYGNKDLPKNIFEDPDHWFYPISPLDRYKSIKSISTKLSSNTELTLNEALDRLEQIMQSVNQLRFKIDNFINANDLSDSNNQATIYAMLENGVQLYDSFYQEKEELYALLKVTYNNEITLSKDKYLENLQNIYSDSKQILEALHFGFNSQINGLHTQLNQHISTANNSQNTQESYKNTIQSAIDFSALANKYLTQDAFSEKHKLYGKNYYYHNVELAALFNSYGRGVAKYINQYIDESGKNHLKVAEEPHYYKVIYPEKEIKLSGTPLVVESVPEKMKDREVVMRQQKVKVDEKKLLLEIYDNKQEDGDIISLNFNGRWIIEKRKLLKRALKIVVDLNETGENYLILHAENLGEIPPNTIAIRYYYEGKRQLIVLNSDLNESEMIQLDFQK